MNDQLPLFEGHRPDSARLSISGGFATVDGATIPQLKIGTRVRWLVEGEVTAVTHKLGKEGMERQHVVVLDGFTADEDHPRGNDRDMKVTIHADGHEPVETTSGAISDLAEELAHHAPDDAA